MRSTINRTYFVLISHWAATQDCHFGLCLVLKPLQGIAFRAQKFANEVELQLLQVNKLSRNQSKALMTGINWRESRPPTGRAARLGEGSSLTLGWSCTGTITLTWSLTGLPLWTSRMGVCDDEPQELASQKELLINSWLSLGLWLSEGECGISCALDVSRVASVLSFNK